MYYPTVKCSITDEIHLVMDEHYSDCGHLYNVEGAVGKRLFKKIKFRTFGQISCTCCHLSMRKELIAAGYISINVRWKMPSKSLEE
jgi:hypothetical protein